MIDTGQLNFSGISSAGYCNIFLHQAVAVSYSHVQYSAKFDLFFFTGCVYISLSHQIAAVLITTSSTILRVSRFQEKSLVVLSAKLV